MERADEVVLKKILAAYHCSLTNERTRFRALESQFISFKRERHKAIQLVALLRSFQTITRIYITMWGSSLKTPARSRVVQRVGTQVESISIFMGTTPAR